MEVENLMLTVSLYLPVRLSLYQSVESLAVRD